MAHLLGVTPMAAAVAVVAIADKSPHHGATAQGVGALVTHLWGATLPGMLTTRERARRRRERKLETRPMVMTMMMKGTRRARMLHQHDK